VSEEAKPKLGAVHLSIPADIPSWPLAMVTPLQPGGPPAQNTAHHRYRSWVDNT